MQPAASLTRRWTKHRGVHKYFWIEIWIGDVDAISSTTGLEGRSRKRCLGELVQVLLLAWVGQVDLIAVLLIAKYRMCKLESGGKRLYV